MKYINSNEIERILFFEVSITLKNNCYVMDWNQDLKLGPKHKSKIKCENPN